jgi:hypothetical protein
VHSDVKFIVVSGAVNIPFENDPSFVQEILGPEVIPTLSVAVKDDRRVPVETVVKLAGLNSNEGA